MMKATSFRDEGSGNDPESLDPVWGLLGAAPRPTPDGWFVARTLARCRLAGAQRAARMHTLARVWRWALGAGLAACVLGAAAFPHLHHAKQQSVVAVPPRKCLQEAFAIIASMEPQGDGTQGSTSNSWPDSTF